MPRTFGKHVHVLLGVAIDRAETSLENYREKLLEFLMYVSKNVWAVTYHQVDALRETLDVVKILRIKMAKYSRGQVRDQVVIAWERVTIKHVNLQSIVLKK